LKVPVPHTYAELAAGSAIVSHTPPVTQVPCCATARLKGRERFTLRVALTAERFPSCACMQVFEQAREDVARQEKQRERERRAADKKAASAAARGSTDGDIRRLALGVKVRGAKIIRSSLLSSS
jgi:hypothetical protein